ncbi:hypothetical protein L7F22_015934 [Adiantum nelumboides]|nr:hypothetical protein [Adiantum nelumboides]
MEHRLQRNMESKEKWKLEEFGEDASWPGSQSALSAAGELPVLGTLHFSLKKLRAREVHGSYAFFFHALCTSIPSCTHIGILGVHLASLDELDALCRGISSPLCTLHSLELDVRLSYAQNQSAELKRLVGDSLACNSSIQQLTVVSKLFCQTTGLPPTLMYLHVKIVGEDTLDVLLGVLAGLAHNSIPLTSLSITGPYGIPCHTSTTGFERLTMLDSEKQLGMSLSMNTSLTSLHFYDLIMPYEAFDLLFSSLNKNFKVTSFSLCGYPDLPGKVVSMLFTALEKNLHLNSLCLSYSNVEDWPSAISVLNSI